MALDAGTVEIKINAQTGEAKENIDGVKKSLTDLGDASKLIDIAMGIATSKIASKALGLAGKTYSSLVVPFYNAERDINSTGEAAQSKLSALGNAAAGIAGAIPVVGNLISEIITGQTALAAEEMKILDGYKTELKGYIDEVAGYADTVLTNSALTGFSTEMVQVYMAMQGITDVDYSTIETAMRFFKSAMADAAEGSGDAYDALTRLRISLTNPDGSNKSLSDLWKETTKAVQENAERLDEIQLGAIEEILFGSRAAMGLQPIFKNAELSYDALYELASGFALLSNTELNLSGAIQDLQDLAAEAEKTKEKVMGLQFAALTGAATEAELNYDKIALAYERGEINSETGMLYTEQDVVAALTAWNWDKKLLDEALNAEGKKQKEKDEASTKAVKNSRTKEEAISTAIEGFSDLPKLLSYYQTDDRNKESVSAFYAAGLGEMFNFEFQQEVANKALESISSERIRDIWGKQRDPHQLEQFNEIMTKAANGELIFDVDTLTQIGEFIDSIGKWSGSQINKNLNSLDEAVDLAYGSIFYQGSAEDLVASAYPESPPDGITGPAATEPSTQIDQQTNFDGASRADSHDTIITNNYNNSADLSTGDMN